MAGKSIVRRNVPDHSFEGGDHLHPLVSHLFHVRGISDASELDLSLKHLLPADGLAQVDIAARVLADAIIQKKRLLIVGDFDADGATSTAIGVLALRAFGAHHVDYLVPNRFEFGYGLTPEIVQVALDRKPDVLITVDNGIASIDGVKAAKDAGLTVVVTDHHLAGSELPEADAIVNPNAPGCTFASKALAGCGVIFSVMRVLRSELVRREWFTREFIKAPDMSEFLDIVALGTVADVVPLDRNNRILVNEGLRRIRAGLTRPGIKALVEVSKRNLKELSCADLGFAIGPRLNAAGRLEDMSIGIECLITEDPRRANQIAADLDELNKSRREIEQGMQAQAEESLSKLTAIDAESLPWGVAIYDPEWHQGVIGILAARIKEKYYRPVIAFAKAGDDIKGSARSIPGLNIRDALDVVHKRNPGIIKKFGGHAMAAGLTLYPGQFEAFAKAFDETVRTLITESDLQASVVTDGPLEPEEFTMEVARAIKSASPWGQCFPEPMFDGEFQVINHQIVGERHLKMVLAEPRSGLKINAIAFNIDPDAWSNQCDYVRTAFKLDINAWRGQESLQLLVDYIEPLN